MASQEVLIALEKLHLELDKLEPAIKHVETAQLVTQTVKDIPQKHIELLKEVQKADIQYKGELKDLFSESTKMLTEEYKKLAATTNEIQQQVKYEQTYLAQLREAAMALYKKMEDIHFPERLDKLDANISGIIACIQSVQSRIDNLERNILDRLKELAEYQKESHAEILSFLLQTKISIQATVDNAAQKSRILAYVTWVLIIIGIVISFLIKYKMKR